jgi:hypothetical protein
LQHGQEVEDTAIFYSDNDMIVDFPAATEGDDEDLEKC